MEYTLKGTIEREISALNTGITKSKTKLDENFTYNFEWGYAEELYLLTLQKAFLSQFVEFISEQPERAKEWLTHNIGRIKKEIVRGGFLGTSTSIYSNLAHTYKKEVDCKLLEKYELYLEWITSEKEPMQIL